MSVNMENPDAQDFVENPRERIEDYARRLGYEVTGLRRIKPEWEPGDVVRVQTVGLQYPWRTRDGHGTWWGGPFEWNDDDINQLFSRGVVQLVARAGKPTIRTES